MAHSLGRGKGKAEEEEEAKERKKRHSNIWKNSDRTISMSLLSIKYTYDCVAIKPPWQ